MCDIGAKIKELRDQKGWSQRNLAMRAKMSNTEIARIEKGERNNPTLDVVFKLSNAFGISVNYFLSIIGVTNPSEEKFNKEELDLINDYRDLKDSNKKVVAQVISALKCKGSDTTVAEGANNFIINSDSSISGGNDFVAGIQIKTENAN